MSDESTPTEPAQGAGHPAPPSDAPVFNRADWPDQPGYDALAQVYAQTFPDAYTTPLERHVIEAFAQSVRARTGHPLVVDVGAGIGHVSAHLEELGCRVIAVEPSAEMRRHAQHSHPGLDLRDGDASLTNVDLSGVDGILARFSLIHSAPTDVAAVLRQWHRRLPGGAIIVLACQSSDSPGVHPFDHAVAPAWRWHPDTLADALADASFTEQWRTISRPNDGHHRFPELHMLATAETHTETSPADIG